MNLSHVLSHLIERVLNSFSGDRLDGRTQLDGIPSFGSPFNYDSIVSDTLIGHATLPGKNNKWTIKIEITGIVFLNI